MKTWLDFIARCNQKKMEQDKAKQQQQQIKKITLYVFSFPFWQWAPQF